MSEINNVTVRRARALSISDCNLDESLANHTLDGTVCSMPDISDDDDIDLITQLKKNIDDLTNKLCSANGEIDSLSLQIEKLKKENENLIRKTSLYKQIVTTNTPKKRGTKNSKQVGCINKQTQTDSEITVKEKVTKNCDQQKTITTHSSPQMAPLPSNEQGTTEKYTQVNQHKLKNKLCILSTNKTNNILTLAKEYFTDNYQICHYLTPNVDIMHLLRDLQTKLQHYTKNDFCIILIGEEDFKTTKCYLDIITHMRNALQNIKNTNIIIALPTYKYNNDDNILYNSRVELFNNMLCMDNITHNYSYVLDSNLNLSYHHSTYIRSGTIKDCAMRVIFEDLFNLRSEILEENALIEDSEAKDQFFLQ